MTLMHGLKVWISLPYVYPDNEWFFGDPQIAKDLIDAFASRYDGDRRIYMVDLMNELNNEPHDWEPRADMLAWVREIAPYWHSVCSLPLTLQMFGINSYNGDRQIQIWNEWKDYFDVVDIHIYYSDISTPEIFEDLLSRLRYTVGNKTIKISETGHSTYLEGGVKQKEIIQSYIEIADKCGVKFISIWTLNDFVRTKIPEKERHFGILDMEYNEKPICAYILNKTSLTLK